VSLKRGRSITVRANPPPPPFPAVCVSVAATSSRQVKGVFSKENLTVAGGGVAATVLTNFILSRTKADGTSLLPMPAGETAEVRQDRLRCRHPGAWARS
jgi:hypothetical protein